VGLSAEAVILALDVGAAKDLDDATRDHRITEYTYNYKGQLLLEENSQAPHVFYEYNDDEQLAAIGLYSSVASINVSTDVPTTESTNRMGLTEYSYDDLARRWKTVVRKINASDGSITASSEIETQLWFDAANRVIKMDGEDLVKRDYDRFGRPTHTFILGSHNDSVYADADDVTGDIVMEEHQTTYESGTSDDVVMTASIDRFYDDRDTGSGETTGAMDTNADADVLLYTAANLEGRIQITSNWYDRFGRLTDTAAYGTNGGSNFDRDGLAVPSRSDTILLTEYTYNPDGSLKEVTDPRAKLTRYTYDDAGRQTKIQSNYVDGTPGGGSNDDEDQTISYAYTDGLTTSMTADMSSNDQTTTYTYGVTTGQSPASNITVNNLLRQATYPDDAGGSRGYVVYAYNGLGEQISMEDQATNKIDTEYDTGGRITKRTVTTLASGFDGAVRRIEYAYDSLSRQSTVTQYDATTSGNVVDQVKFTYNDWGPVSKFEQDHNSTVATGGTYLYDIDYTYERATGGRNTVRKITETLPSGNVITFAYLSTSGRHDDNLSRVTDVKDGSVVLSRYWSNGVDHLVGTILAEADVQSIQYPGSFNSLDRFNRRIIDRWTKQGAAINFYNNDITYDRNSNIELVEDNVHTGRDVDYTIDSINRLIKAEEGTWNGSAITTRTRQEIWTLTQTGNWDLFKLDINGDNDFVDANELNDDRTHNVVNELTARDTDDNGTDNYTLTYDANGNLTDDAEAWEFEYDGFNRLRKVKNQSGTLVAEYRYNGLNYRITQHQDTDTDGDVDANDTILHYAYDERWRIVAVFEDSDSTPLEEFVHHNSGLGGWGTSSYIDDVILRDRNADGVGTSLEERRYYCQNWHHDVVAVVTDLGKLVEQVRYSPYGVPFGYPAGDTDSDGDWDATDTTAIKGGGAYSIREDADLDGDNDTADETHANSITSTYQTLGRTVITSTAVDNFFGYAGYVFDDRVGDKWHVRYRVLDSALGQWLTRDPMDYGSGANLYSYVDSDPTDAVDPFGLEIWDIIPPEWFLTITGGRGYTFLDCMGDCIHRLTGYIDEIVELITIGGGNLIPGIGTGKWRNISPVPRKTGGGRSRLGGSQKINTTNWQELWKSRFRGRVPLGLFKFIGRANIALLLAEGGIMAIIEAYCAIECANRKAGGPVGFVGCLTWEQLFDLGLPMPWEVPLDIPYVPGCCGAVGDDYWIVGR
jgi:RHS repeat-associated protein